MPSSGCIALRTCITGCACSSISCAVTGAAQTPSCLSVLSTTAGKSAPHAMSEFYNYVPTPTTFDVNMNVDYYGGHDNMEGMAYLRDSNNNEYDSYYINGVSVSFSWTNVLAGTYYVDMSNVVSMLAGIPQTTSYSWSDSHGSGFTPYNSLFSGANNVYFEVY